MFRINSLSQLLSHHILFLLSLKQVIMLSINYYLNNLSYLMFNHLVLLFIRERTYQHVTYRIYVQSHRLSQYVRMMLNQLIYQLDQIIYLMKMTSSLVNHRYLISYQYFQSFVIKVLCLIHIFKVLVQFISSYILIPY